MSDLAHALRAIVQEMSIWNDPVMRRVAAVERWREEIARVAAAIADRNPSGGDAKQAPSQSDESGGAKQSPKGAA